MNTIKFEEYPKLDNKNMKQRKLQIGEHLKAGDVIVAGDARTTVDVDGGVYSNPASTIFRTEEDATYAAPGIRILIEPYVGPRKASSFLRRVSRILLLDNPPK
jgi:hypothetical protein